VAALIENERSWRQRQTAARARVNGTLARARRDCAVAIAIARRRTAAAQKQQSDAVLPSAGRRYRVAPEAGMGRWTDASGIAACNNLTTLPTLSASLGYTASFAGSAQYLATSIEVGLQIGP
jgi:hypothetical protein